MSSQLIPKNSIGETFSRRDSSAIPTTAELRELCAFAARGLAPMLDPESKLFCRRFIQQDSGMVREGVSYRYTAMTLLGLRQYELSGGKSPIDFEGTVNAFFDRTASIDNIGDLGLLLWVCAKVAPDQLAKVCKAGDVGSALDRFRGAREGNSMELSWFLTGLAFAALSDSKAPANWDTLAKRTYEILRKNQGRHGFFGHVARRGAISGVIRGAIGSFADQVYPIIALSKFSIAYGDKAALTAAVECGAAICNAQGELGQWWWHYDAETGRVVQPYPVYSVHQHAMAPMALIALKEDAQRDFYGPMFKGLNWIFGGNELNTSMCDPSSSVVWRAIQPSSRLRLGAHQVMSYLGLPERHRNLKILFQCWPYELGWLLYAFSGFNA